MTGGNRQVLKFARGITNMTTNKISCLQRQTKLLTCAVFSKNLDLTLSSYSAEFVTLHNAGGLREH